MLSPFLRLPRLPFPDNRVISLLKKQPGKPVHTPESPAPASWPMLPVPMERNWLGDFFQNKIISVIDPDRIFRMHSESSGRLYGPAYYRRISSRSSLSRGKD